MPRKRLIRTSTGAYHVTSRVNHQHDFPLPLQKCWAIFLNILKRVTENMGAEIHAFVLMSNHYHLLLTTPQRNIDEIMKYLNREVTRAISRESGLINHIFGARYHPTIVYAPRDFAHVLKYIYRNPVKAGLVEATEAYPFSTVMSLANPRRFPFLRANRFFSDALSGENFTERIAWLNEPLPKEQEELIRKTLKKREFKFSNRIPEQKKVARFLPPPWLKVSRHLLDSICR